MELSALQQEFLDDHRVLIAGIKGIIEALEGGDSAKAVALASELDRQAGAHMAFEEEVFYPRLAEVYGEEFVTQMVSEHEAGQRAVRTLLAKNHDQPLTAEQREHVLEDLDVALKHVMSCGTMLSELSSGAEGQDARALERLRRLRDQGERWTGRTYAAD
jgi:hemerythrin-like domain-containing protein